MVRVASLALVVALAGCGDEGKGGGTSNPGPGLATGTGTGSGTGTGTGTGSGTGTGTGASTTPPTADMANCVGYFEQTDDLDNDAYMRGITWTYDANGNAVKAEQDLDGDQAVEDVWEYVFDGNGNTIENKHDTNNDGTWDELYVFTYDGNNNRLTRTIDTNADGTVDESTAYTYDGSDNLIERAYDNDNNGTVDEKETWTYDGSGNRTAYAYDADNDGTPEVTRVYAMPGLVGGDWYYNEDIGADGSDENRHEEGSDSNGITNFIWDDYGIDGVVDNEFNMIYWPNELLDKIDATIYDSDLVIPAFGLDGYIDYHYQVTYDANGRVATNQEFVDLDHDGQPTGNFDSLSTETVTWTGCTN